MATVPLADGSGDALVYRRRHLAPWRPVGRVTRRDIWDALLIFAGAAVARTTRPQAWERSCQLVARTRLRRWKAAPDRLRDSLTAVAGRNDPAEIARLVRDHRTNVFRRRMLYAAELAGRMGGAEIGLSPADADRLRAALGRGKGAIVWVDETYVGALIAKRALTEAGFAPRQVSTEDHGISLTRFGLAVLNPLHVRAENHYLAERITFPRDSAAEATRRILKALKAGGLVVMTNSEYAGAGFVELPLGPGAYLSLATTALNLALRHGVPLFSMAAIEVAPFARYHVEIGAEVGAAAKASGRAGDDLLAAAAAIVRDEALARIRRWPDQYPLLLSRRILSSRFPGERAAGGRVPPAAPDPKATGVSAPPFIPH